MSRTSDLTSTHTSHLSACLYPAGTPHFNHTEVLVVLSVPAPSRSSCPCIYLFLSLIGSPSCPLIQLFFLGIPTTLYKFISSKHHVFTILSPLLDSELWENRNHYFYGFPALYGAWCIEVGDKCVLNDSV